MQVLATTQAGHTLNGEDSTYELALSIADQLTHPERYSSELKSDVQQCIEVLLRCFQDNNDARSKKRFLLHGQRLNLHVLRDALDQVTLGDRYTSITADVFASRALLTAIEFDYLQAYQLAVQGLTFDPNHMDCLGRAGTYAMAICKFTSAQAHFQRRYELLKTHASSDKLVRVRATNDLAGALSQQFRMDESEALYSEALAMLADLSSRPAHLLRALVLNNLAGNFLRKGRGSVARNLLTEAYGLREAQSDKRINLAFTANNLGDAYRLVRQVDDAMFWYHEAERLVRLEYDRIIKDHFFLGRILNNRGALQSIELKQWKVGAETLREAKRILEVNFFQEHSLEMIIVNHNIGQSLLELSSVDEAMTYFEASLRGAHRALPRENPIRSAIENDFLELTTSFIEPTT